MPSSEDLESERQELLQRLASDLTSYSRTEYDPGSFGCHELLDRTSLVLDLLERHIAEHPACLQQPSWFALARAAAGSMSQLYREIGSLHLGTPSPNNALQRTEAGRRASSEFQP